MTSWTIYPRHLSRRKRRLIGFLMLLVSVAVVVWVALSASDSGSGKPDNRACKAAMQRQFAYGIAHPDGPAGTRPAACDGVSDSDLQRYADEILRNYMDNP